DKLRQLTEKLVSKREGTAGTAHGDENINDLHGRMAGIKELCADYDRKGALDLLNEIRNCSKETREVLDRITEHVIHSDFEEAEKEAEAFAARLSPSFIKQKIDGLDIEKGFQRYEGDEKLYLKVLRSYKSSVRSLLEEIENEPDEGTINNYEIKVHGIKGTSLDICAEKIGKKAKELEEAAKTGDFDYIHEHHKTFLADAWKLIGDLEKMFDGLDAENPKPLKDSPDPETLKQLLTACREYDIYKADNAMAEIEKYKYEADDGLANWLRDNLDRTNFDEIVEKLRVLQ
ncbi:MAG: Hpt domain-containing protein, partial [Treponema sp.]|nr:Hpt domain-containing protein [Treponema sp.]